MIENEFKIMLTEEQYDKLRCMFAWSKKIDQTNYYYDTAELFMVNSDITCRVREIGGEFLLQMKLPNGPLHSRIEVEESLGVSLPDSLSGETLTALCGRDGMPDVRLLGSLSTLRFAKDFGGMELDLDKSTYFGRTDYELEIEFTDEAAARALLSELKEKTGISPRGEVCLGKMYRFLDEYKKTDG